MDIGVIGVNHKSADLNFREDLAKTFSRNKERRYWDLFSKVVLFTCNRFEVYFHSPNLTRAHSSLLHDFTEEFNQNSAYKLYSYFGKDCFFHLSKVTTGLDSAIFCETEIQGQVKKAYLDAAAEGSCHRDLHFLFQKSLKIGKEMRSQLQIKSEPHNLVSTTKELVHQKVPSGPLLFIGASQTNMNMIRALKSHQYQIVLSNRTEAKGRYLASELEIDYMPWKDRSSWIDFDGIICATTSPEYLLNTGQKIDSKKLIIDLSVPRDADPKLGQDPLVTLYNIDQINKLVRKKRKLSVPPRGELAEKIHHKVLLHHQSFLNKSRVMEKIV